MPALMAACICSRSQWAGFCSLSIINLRKSLTRSRGSKKLRRAFCVVFVPALLVELVCKCETVCLRMSLLLYSEKAHLRRGWAVYLRSLMNGGERYRQMEPREVVKNREDGGIAVKTSLSLPPGVYERFQAVAKKRGMKIGAAAAQAMEDWMAKFDDRDREYLESVFRTGSGNFRPLEGDRTSKPASSADHGISAGEALWVSKLLSIMRHGDADLQTGIQLTVACYERYFKQNDATK